MLPRLTCGVPLTGLLTHVTKCFVEQAKTAGRRERTAETAPGTVTLAEISAGRLGMMHVDKAFILVVDTAFRLHPNPTRAQRMHEIP